MADVIIQIQATAKGMKEAQDAVKALRDQLNSVLGTNKSVGESATKAGKGFDNMGSSARRSMGDVFHLRSGIKGFTQDLKELLTFQMRWYAARTLIFAPIEGMGAALRSIITYAAQLDESRAKILRWYATQGKVTQEDIANTAGIMIQIKRAMTEYPVELKDITDAVEAFAGAGVKGRTIERLVPDIARLKTAFKEIDFQQFAIAFTGAFNSFGKSIKGAGDEVQVFRTLFEQMLRAQAVGLIRPEDFARVMQYMGQMSKIAGFATEEMFAIAVAITDVGSRASNSARYAQGMMQAFAKKETVGLLKQIGVSINEDATLASQFTNIIAQLHGKLGENGELSIRNMRVLQQIMGSKEAARGFLPLIQDAEKVKKLIEDIKNSQGGLAASSTVMQQNVVGQWQIFKNILNLTGVEISKLTGSNMNQMLGMLISVAQGVLVAATSSGIYSDKLSKLTDTGKGTFYLVRSLIEIFRAFGEVLSYLGPPLKALISGFATLVFWLSENTKVIQALIVIITTKLVTSLFTKLGVVKLVTSGVVGLMWAVKNLGFVLEYFAVATLPKLLMSLGWIGIALSVVTLAMDTFGDKTKEVDSIFAGFKADFATKSLKEVSAELKKNEQELKWAKEDLDAIKNDKSLSNYTSNKLSREKEKEIALLEKKIPHLKKLQETLSQDQINTNKTATADQAAWLEDQQKSFAKNQINSLKEYYNARFAIFKSNADLEGKKLDDSHTRGLISEKQYYDSRLKNIYEYKNKALADLDKEKELQDKLYGKERAEIGSNDKYDENTRSAAFTAVNEKEKADNEKLAAKRVEIENKADADLIKIRLEFLDNSWRKTEAILKLEEQLKLEKTQDELANQQWVLTEGQKSVKDSYEHRKTTVTEYYNDLKVLIKKIYDTEVALENARYAQTKKLLDAKRQDPRYKEDLEAQRELAKQELNNEQQNKNTLNKLNRDYISGVAEQNRDFANDAQAVWEKTGKGGGFAGVWKLSLEDIKKKYGEWGTLLRNMSAEIADGMQSAFSEGFFDFLTGELKSLSDYISSFLKSVLKAISNTFASQLTNVVMGATSSLFFANGGVFNNGSVVPFAGGGVITKPVVFPMANGNVGMAGEAGYEGILPLKRGNDGKLGVINYGGTKESGTPAVNIEIKLENTTGQPLSVRQGGTTFDMKKFVVTAIIEDFKGNGPTRKVFRGVNN